MLAFNFIPFYNILNMFFTGAMFSFGLYMLSPKIFENFSTIEIFQNNPFVQTMLMVIILYYMGFLVDRFASLVIEKILKNKNKTTKRNIVSKKLQMNWQHYSEYQKAEKKSEHIKTLAREYTFSRNSMTLALILTILSLFAGNWVYCSVTWPLTIFLYFSMKKHADKISQRVDYYKNHSD